ncbi:cyclin-dependent kinase C-1-like [Argentina anserina]|uniref:cyclin-dependent kinase C-1-like n=1 Tax=Argentina anserina TaxID=57926 RepID=UPI002176214B|nr:cyclin-dependent kinase C-1-like [Potentilla anserina]
MAVAARGQLNFNEVHGGFKGVDSFEKLELLGQGTYGEVHKAKEKGTGEVVALKKLKLAKENYEVEGFPIAAIREIKILNKFHHENIIKLKEIVTSPVQNNQVLGDCGIYMVFEYMEHDLTGLVNRQGARFSVPQVKCYMKQLLMGLHYCHLNGVLHRDIKSSNLFINNQGRLKLGDFGLARNFSAEEDHQNAKLTSQVVTLWYRPPELLLGTKSYGPEVDMWSAGCIFAELLCQGRPLFNSNTEAGVLSKIVEVCGVPGEASWPGVSKLPWYETFLKNMKSQQRPLSEIFRHCDRPTLELLEKLLTLDPSKRISARDALDADYFWTDPLPCDPKSLRPYESSHELDVQNDKKKRKLQQLQDEKNVVKCQKPMQYQQPLPRGNPPPSHQKSEQAEAREEPFRRSYSSLSPVAARPRRCYESRPPRPSYGARRYYESDRYASGRDRYSNMRDGRRKWRY